MIKAKQPDQRHRAVCKVARDTLRVDLDMDHRETQRSFTTQDIQRALEAAYDAGRRQGMS